MKAVGDKSDETLQNIITMKCAIKVTSVIIVQKSPNAIIIKVFNYNGRK